MCFLHKNHSNFVFIDYSGAKYAVKAVEETSPFPCLKAAVAVLLFDPFFDPEQEISLWKQRRKES